MAGLKKAKAQQKSGEALPAGLEQVLGHHFQQPDLLTLALTHRSFVYDAGLSAAAGDLADPSLDNEQLEFVGDAVLGLLAAEALCNRFPTLREGELTRLRSAVVSRKHLGSVGTRLGLGRWLRLGHTAEKNQGRHNAALFANAVEALIAALYLDGGLPAARKFVENEVLADALPRMEQSLAEGDQVNATTGDHKSGLQEILQAAGAHRPVYTLLEESGPDHQKSFRVEVRLHGAAEALAEAMGPTKKQAQQEAARLAIAALGRQTAGVHG